MYYNILKYAVSSEMYTYASKTVHGIKVISNSRALKEIAITISYIKNQFFCNPWIQDIYDRQLWQQQSLNPLIPGKSNDNKADAGRLQRVICSLLSVH